MQSRTSKRVRTNHAAASSAEQAPKTQPKTESASSPLRTLSPVEKQAIDFVHSHHDFTGPEEMVKAAEDLQAQAQRLRLAARLAQEFGGALPITSPLVDDLEMLVPGNDLTELALWASHDGRLFLWTGHTRVVPREVHFEEAREWWTKFQSHAPELAPPFFEENTAAERLVSIVCKAMREQPANVAQRGSGDPRQKEFSGRELENAIEQSVALTALLEHRLTYDECGSDPEPVATAFRGGVLELTHATQRRLLAVKDDYYADRKGGAR